jgi:GT2 family glycosyltransferase
MEETPLISVIVLNWNGIHFLDQCLSSLMRQTYAPLEVIVVDNGSTDDSIDLIKDKFSGVRLIVNNKNLGFGGGNNIGIKESRGRYIMVLNNDTRVEPDCIEELKKSIEKNKKYGACATKILLKSDETLIDAAGIVIGLDGVSIGRGRLEKEDYYPTEEEVFFASGCAGLYRREMLEEIGFYDEDFFAYAEDTDLGFRARLAGWRCVYNPKAVVYHYHSASSGTYSHLKAYLVERNRIWVSIKNFPIKILILGQFYTLSRYFWQAYGAFAGKGAAGRFTSDFSKMELVSILIKVYLSLWRSLPILLKKRRANWKRKSLPNREIYRLFRNYGISAREIALRE